MFSSKGEVINISTVINKERKRSKKKETTTAATLSGAFFMVRPAWALANQ
ncbi:MAG: hypothetical protein HQL29_00110 [Candidatus Omnitrophica bacterium]|nr:hypothetical protein [Candidatus Omnitrophota bacterium]